jgi:hypothetical protein
MAALVQTPAGEGTTNDAAGSMMVECGGFICPGTADGEELKRAYQESIAQSARRSPVADFVSQTVELYGRVGQSAELSPGEKRRMERVLRGRLLHLRDRLETEFRRDVRSKNSRLNGGGGTSQGMQQLIDLIQTTIEPESWTAGAGAAAVGFGTSFAGGGGAGGPSGGANAAALRLADLIRTNTSPETWDINGGPGTISVFGK